MTRATRTAAATDAHPLGIAVGIAWEHVEGVIFLDPDLEIRRFTSPREAARFLMDFAQSIERIWLLKEAII